MNPLSPPFDSDQLSSTSRPLSPRRSLRLLGSAMRWSVAGLSSLVLGCGCAQNLNYLARPTHYLRGLQTVQTGCQFYHGVASGDPTPDGVILWTRVTVDGNFPEVSPSAADPGNVVVDVSWTVSLDEAAQQLVQSGTVQTDGEVDFTVKVDVSGLEPASTYFYQFSACGLNSIPGRTKTLPMRDADVSELRVAAFSCTDYARGHLYAYDLLFRMYEDIDVGLHLGDFIYEYLPPPEERDYYANGDVAEPDVPKLLTLDDYRQRYSWYRRNQALIDASRAFPWIVVPDDHEVANNSWRDGAEGDAHVDETDGPWPTRLGAALRAYFEWLPIRQEETGSYKIYRQFTWGKLLDLWMLDTRYDGRDEQVGDSPSITDDPFGYQQWVSKAFQNSIMSDVQMNWLTTGLATSDRVWKVLGNQVPFTDTKDPITDGGSIAWQDDQWCGYKRSQAQVLDAIRNVSDVVILTGDTHIPYILETFQNPDKDGEPYAVEFCTPSITSNTHGESMIRFENATPSDVLDYTEMIIATNPWMFDVEMLQHGFVSVTFSADKVRSIYYGVGDVVAPPPYETEVYRDFTACRGRSRVYRTPDAPC